jgi:hypothetical protein
MLSFLSQNYLLKKEGDIERFQSESNAELLAATSGGTELRDKANETTLYWPEEEGHVGFPRSELTTGEDRNVIGSDVLAESRVLPQELFVHGNASGVNTIANSMGNDGTFEISDFNSHNDSHNNSSIKNNNDNQVFDPRTCSAVTNNEINAADNERSGNDQRESSIATQAKEESTAPLITATHSNLEEKNTSSNEGFVDIVANTTIDKQSNTNSCRAMEGTLLLFITTVFSYFLYCIPQE